MSNPMAGHSRAMYDYDETFLAELVRYFARHPVDLVRLVMLREIDAEFELAKLAPVVDRIN